MPADASGKNLETLTNELVIYAAKCWPYATAQAPNIKPTRITCGTIYDEQIWPFFHTALDAIGKSTTQTRAARILPARRMCLRRLPDGGFQCHLHLHAGDPVGAETSSARWCWSVTGRSHRNRPSAIFWP